MRQRVFVIVESDPHPLGGCGDPRCPGQMWKEFPDVTTANQWMDSQTGKSCVVALGPEVIDDIRPNGGASAIASDLARRAGRSLGRGRKRK